jgi:molecular chaperone GrpE (heat shock protein)
VHGKRQHIIEFHARHIDKGGKSREKLEEAFAGLESFAGLEVIPVKPGQDKFNPKLHNKILEDTVFDKESNLILEVISNGYRHKASNTVLAKTQVKVNIKS